MSSGTSQESTPASRRSSSAGTRYRYGKSGSHNSGDQRSTENSRVARRRLLRFAPLERSTVRSLGPARRRGPRRSGRSRAHCPREFRRCTCADLGDLGGIDIRSDRFRKLYSGSVMCKRIDNVSVAHCGRCRRGPDASVDCSREFGRPASRRSYLASSHSPSPGVACPPLGPEYYFDDPTPGALGASMA